MRRHWNGNNKKREQDKKFQQKCTKSQILSRRGVLCSLCLSYSFFLHFHLCRVRSNKSCRCIVTRLIVRRAKTAIKYNVAKRRETSILKPNRHARRVVYAYKGSSLGQIPTGCSFLLILALSQNVYTQELFFLRYEPLPIGFWVNTRKNIQKNR